MHIRPWILLLLAAWVLLAPARGSGQVTLNPDISVISRFLLSTDDGSRLEEGVRQFSQPEFAFQELELALQGYLNPYARADLFLTLPGPDIEESKLGIEELYATILRGLPLDLTARFGKYRVDFGKINRQHPHMWPFITQPLVEERFLGEEGLNDLGISLSALLPTGDLYSSITADVLRGGSIGEATGIEDTTDSAPFYANSARFMVFLPVGDDADLELGLSGYTGIHDPYHRDRFWYGNVDFKYKYRPSTYTSLTIQGEYLMNWRKASQDRDFTSYVDGAGNPERRSITSSGLYLYADYQFLGIFSVGGRYDWSQAPYSTEDRAQAGSFFFTYFPVEETLGIRLHYQHTRTESPGVSQGVNFVGLQLLFSLGVHKAHPF
jgi:hypothetical protein